MGVRYFVTLASPLPKKDISDISDISKFLLIFLSKILQRNIENFERLCVSIS